VILNVYTVYFLAFASDFNYIYYFSLVFGLWCTMCTIFKYIQLMRLSRLPWSCFRRYGNSVQPT